MRYTEEMITAFKQRILINADVHQNDLVQYCADNLSLSKNTVTKYIAELITEGKLLRTQTGRYTAYTLPAETKSFSFTCADTKSEEDAWRAVLPFVGKQQPEVMQILDYSFLEMCNNVLEHSGAEHFSVTVEKTLTKIRIIIADDGIGIFAKIKNDMQLWDENQAVIELSKGKFTSSPQNHSGEGIFFSSKLCDQFAIFSGTLSYSPQETIPKDSIPLQPVQGTTVVLTVLCNTQKKAQSIFSEFAGTDSSEPQFKTIVQVRFMEQEGISLTSRSQARRLLNRLEKFTCAVFDFSGVSFIGQAFADEIFRVYPTKNTHTKLEYINANESIEAMIVHVKQ